MGTGRPRPDRVGSRGAWLRTAPRSAPRPPSSRAAISSAYVIASPATSTWSSPAVISRPVRRSGKRRCARCAKTGLEVEAGRLWALSEFRHGHRHVLDCTFFATTWSGRPRLGTDPDGAAHPATLIGVEWLDRESFAEAPFRPTLLARWLRAHWESPDVPAAYLGMESG